MLYGHRKDIEGFARSLEEFDANWRGRCSMRCAPRTILLITADHGCDPNPVNPTTDHSREYVPVLAYSPGVPEGMNLGTRSTLSDLGQTVAENFGSSIPARDKFSRTADAGVIPRN